MMFDYNNVVPTTKLQLSHTEQQQGFQRGGYWRL